MQRRRAIAAIVLIVAGIGLMGADTALAAAAEQKDGWSLMGDKGLAGIGKGVGAGLVVMGGGAGIGRIGGSAVESMARQPESAGTINTAMLITAAMIEGATLFGVLVCLLI